MELRQLRTFKTVADHLSFTKAAQVLHMAQSSVSAQIKALEEELGVRLFDRIGRNILITDPGRSLYDYARRMGEMTKELRHQVSGQDSSQDVGRLVIRVPETIAWVYMPGIVEVYHRDHPWVSLDFINCSDLKLKEELNSGKIDLAFLLTDTVHMKDVNIKLLGSEPLVMAAGPSHQFMGREQISWDDLEDQTLLLPKTD